ncbi:LIM domain containing protein [Acanthamoeba castellanii str. Neff]|uniref:LIM domain containing protein n=1 Tax=Acanthamoeba castellanii (strain ATCC 30010 / Neff) TaxID=1257118 RepID=L8HBY3_ACACF|nr:LIM domain containing protein [Acanthamoeba castellanii str. Neff]ELR21906.1 LIM domain containing protein [Acanthamoeba castellanii str. Neff]
MNGNAKCAICAKTVYAMERMDADGMSFHKTCMKCEECNCTLKLGNYASLAGKYYCKTHFKQLFKLKGNYDQGFGREQPKMKWQKEGGLGFGSGSQSMRQTSSAPVSPVSSPVFPRRTVAETNAPSPLAQKLADSKAAAEAAATEAEANGGASPAEAEHAQAEDAGRRQFAEDLAAFEAERRRFEQEKEEFEEARRQFEAEKELLDQSVAQLEAEKKFLENEKLRVEQPTA